MCTFHVLSKYQKQITMISGLKNFIFTTHELNKSDGHVFYKSYEVANNHFLSLVFTKSIFKYIPRILKNLIFNHFQAP